MKCFICGLEHNRKKYCSSRCIRIAYYRRHHEQQLQRLKTYRETHREITRKATHNWYERTKILKTHEHPCLICGIITLNRKYCSIACKKKAEYRRNRERYAKYMKKYFIDHPERRKQDSKKWNQENRERAYFYELMRPYRTQLRALFNNECQICHSKDDLELHHIRYAWIPNDIPANQKNLILLCKQCHEKQHSGEIILENNNL